MDGAYKLSVIDVGICNSSHEAWRILAKRYSN